VSEGPRFGVRRRPIGDRPAAERGRVAEDAVSDYVLARGGEVLARNLRAGPYEIDLLVREGPVVAVVEVRTRGATAWRGAIASVDARKRRRLGIAGTRVWRERFAKDPSVERMRFDVAAVSFEDPVGPVVEYVRAAFVSGD
jgi:putative endonuclease